MGTMNLVKHYSSFSVTHAKLTHLAFKHRDTTMDKQLEWFNEESEASSEKQGGNGNETL